MLSDQDEFALSPEDLPGASHQREPRNTGFAVPQLAVAAARETAQRAATAAAAGAREALFVMQGPLGISLLCILGGVACITASILGLIDIKSALTSPVNYLVNVYFLLFGLMIIFLEAEPERLGKYRIFSKCVPRCGECRTNVLAGCKFATSLKGRGMFYVFIGSFGVIQWTIASFVAGVWMVACGALLLVVPRPKPEEQAQTIPDEAEEL